MPLTTDTWHTVTFNALSSWTNPIPKLEAFVADAIDTVTTVFVFCVNDNVNGGTSALIRYIDAAGNPGQAVVQHAGVNVITSPAQDTTTWDDGDVWISIRQGVAMLSHSSVAGAVKKIADSSAFGAFAS